MSFYDLDEESKLTRAQQLVAKDKDGAKQLEKVSEQSPGPVADNELLARSLDYPDKFTAAGGVDETLFQDAFTHGASAQRLIRGSEAQSADAHNRFEERAKARREGSREGAAALQGGGRRLQTEARFSGSRSGHRTAEHY